MITACASPTSQASFCGVTAGGGDSAAVIAAKQARDAAQSRVDADRRAHSPGCVAVDQKGLDKAEAQLSAAETQAQQTQPTPVAPATPSATGTGTGSQLSIQV